MAARVRSATGTSRVREARVCREHTTERVSGASFADSVLTVPPLAVADKRRGRPVAAGRKRLAAVN